MCSRFIVSLVKQVAMAPYFVVLGIYYRQVVREICKLNVN